MSAPTPRNQLVWANLALLVALGGAFILGRSLYEPGQRTPAWWVQFVMAAWMLVAGTAGLVMMQVKRAKPVVEAN